ncbi:MAG TPA: hypothetical protein PKD45_15570 [Flavobacteriales bacterium]|nr:hypothetical protein [Flavobacteriales bacterium]
MPRLLPILFFLHALMAMGQTDYRFTKDILQEIEQDSSGWKYQVGATHLTFIGNYAEALRVWDRDHFQKPEASEADSLYFVRCRKVSAREVILERAKAAEITIINEAHHVPAHRVFAQSLLKDLYAQGYRYLGLESLHDTTINERGFPVVESGFYTKEPEFGNLLYEALRLGYTLFPYEASAGKNNREREIEQAANIQAFLESAPPGKTLIYCGYQHANEGWHPIWEKAMAGWLKENTGIDPLTVGQTLFMERSEPENDPLFIRLHEGDEPIMLVDEHGDVFNGQGEDHQTDLVVIHPRTTYIHGRPSWVTTGKERYTIPAEKLGTDRPLMVLAYRTREEEHDGVPADVLEITDANSPPELYLAKGAYTVVIKDAGYEVVGQYEVGVK